MARWALVGGIVALSLLAFAIGVGVFFADTSCATFVLVVEPDAPGGVALDEARVRAEAPRLASLLDQAVAEGRAEETHERSARAMRAYLQDAAGSDVVDWRGTTLRALLAIC